MQYGTKLLVFAVKVEIYDMTISLTFKAFYVRQLEKLC